MSTFWCESTRGVNACHTAAGDFDAAATADRVDDVARGVAVKIGAGAIVNAPEPDAPAPDFPPPTWPACASRISPAVSAN